VQSSLICYGSANAGGLVYSASGRWHVNALSFVNFAFQIDGDDKKTSNTADGLILCDGVQLYLELDYNHYEIAVGTVTVSTTAQYFDEIVGNTAANKSRGTSGQGIVSINTNS